MKRYSALIACFLGLLALPSAARADTVDLLNLMLQYARQHAGVPHGPFQYQFFDTDGKLIRLTCSGVHAIDLIRIEVADKIAVKKTSHKRGRMVQSTIVVPVLVTFEDIGADGELDSVTPHAILKADVPLLKLVQEQLRPDTQNLYDDIITKVIMVLRKDPPI